MSLSNSPAGPVRVLIVDDEALARARLRTLLADVSEPATEVVGEAANATQALVCLQARHCDLVLLDIAMPGRDGTQLAAELQRLDPPPAVVFVTAHAEHALKAFELDAVDYLTKPVRRERLQAALHRVALRLGRSLAGAAAGSASAEAGVIVVSERGRLVRVPLAEVLFLKAELKYVTLRTAEHSYVLDDALADLETRLGERFLRVHRNALVARHAVRALERRSVVGESDDDEGGGLGWAVQVAPLGEWLAVSRRQVAAVKAALGGG